MYTTALPAGRSEKCVAPARHDREMVSQDTLAVNKTTIFPIKTIVII